MTIAFGEFEIDLAARELRRGKSLVTIEPKAFDVLSLLLENRERVVTKDELVDVVWQGRFISDSALSSAVKAARSAVGDDGRSQTVIRTLHGLGFRFVAELRDAPSKSNGPDEVSAKRHGLTNLRRRRRELVGRDAEKAAVIAQLQDGRIVSIVGPGGAGKTSLAIDAAMDLEGAFDGGVWFCEFAPVQEDQIESTVLGAIDSSAGAGHVNAARIADRIGDRSTLIILDNCEHVIGSAARLASELFDLAPNLALLITSREALELPEENIIRISGLNYEAKDSVAVEMFHRCAQQVTKLDRTSETDETVRLIAERLEGLPLAIELATAQLVSYTPDELLHALDDQLSVLAMRRRDGQMRHSAMEDAITWSYDLLDANQRAFLEGLSLFAGAFTVQAAEAVCGASNARRLLHDLVAQSMVTFVPGNPISRFRLLEPIRQFARRQIDEERFVALQERHANWFAKRATELAEAMRGAGEIEAAEALTAEWSDFGRSLAWGRENGRCDIAVEPLIYFEIQLVWQTRMEAFEWLEAGVVSCVIPECIQAKVDVTRAMGAWCASEIDRASALLASSEALGGDEFEICYVRFCLYFVGEDFQRAVACGQRLIELAKNSTNPKQRIMAPAFYACSLAMCHGETDEIPGLLRQVEQELKHHAWPSGRCAELLAHVVCSFGRRDHEAVVMYRRAMEQAAGQCYAFWFNVAAAGMETTQTARSKEDALVDLKSYAANFSSAHLSGDLVLIPTIMRLIVICLVDIENFDLAAKLFGLVPKLRGLGEKGSMSPGYEEAIKRLRASMSADQLEMLSNAGARWELVDVVDALDDVVSG